MIPTSFLAPGLAITAQVPPPTLGYKVQRGDSLAGIAGKYKISVDDIVAWNAWTHANTCSQARPSNCVSAVCNAHCYIPVHTVHGRRNALLNPVRRFSPAAPPCPQGRAAAGLVATADLLLLEESHRLGIRQRRTGTERRARRGLRGAAAGRPVDRLGAGGAGLRHNLAANRRDRVMVVWARRCRRSGRVWRSCEYRKQLPYFRVPVGGSGPPADTGGTVLAAGMDKHLSPAVADLLEHYIGPTERQPANANPLVQRGGSNAARGARRAIPASYYCDEVAGELQSRPMSSAGTNSMAAAACCWRNCPGWRPPPPCSTSPVAAACWAWPPSGRAWPAPWFLLTNPQWPSPPAAPIVHLFGVDQNAFVFHQGDGVADYSGTPADLILCNPPFHLNHDGRICRQAPVATVCPHLPPGGRLCLVANQHLDYPGDAAAPFPTGGKTRARPTLYRLAGSSAIECRHCCAIPQAVASGSPAVANSRVLPAGTTAPAR